MIALIEDNREAIAAICRRYRIRHLDVFGSATTDAFDSDTSDIDVVVDLGDYKDNLLDRYWGLIDSLEELFGRHVDLVTERSIRNPYFRIAVDRQRVRLYEAGDSEAAA